MNTFCVWGIMLLLFWMEIGIGIWFLLLMASFSLSIFDFLEYLNGDQHVIHEKVLDNR